MGGIEALAKMTPEQQAAMAQRMREMLQQNPGAVLQMASAASASAASSGPSAAQVTSSMAIRQDIARMTQEYAALEIAFETRDEAITAAQGSHREIAEMHGVKEARIPFTLADEAGRDRDPVQMLALRKETSTKHRDRAAWELTARRALVAERSRELKTLASAYQTWLNATHATILASSTSQDLLRGTNTLMDVATYEMRFVDTARRLAEYSEAVTREVAMHDVEYRRVHEIAGR